MASAANDNFESYFTEKMWEMIPAFYRDQDGLADNPGVLRALVEIMAREAAVLRRSNDHLWDDEFIDLCNSWAVPRLSRLDSRRHAPGFIFEHAGPSYRRRQDDLLPPAQGHGARAGGADQRHYRLGRQSRGRLSPIGPRVAWSGSAARRVPWPLYRHAPGRLRRPAPASWRGADRWPIRRIFSRNFISGWHQLIVENRIGHGRIRLSSAAPTGLKSTLGT